MGSVPDGTLTGERASVGQTVHAPSVLVIFNGGGTAVSFTVPPVPPPPPPQHHTGIVTCGCVYGVFVASL